MENLVSFTTALNPHAPQPLNNEAQTQSLCQVLGFVLLHVELPTGRVTYPLSTKSPNVGAYINHSNKVLVFVALSSCRDYEGPRLVTIRALYPQTHPEPSILNPNPEKFANPKP